MIILSPEFPLLKLITSSSSNVDVTVVWEFGGSNPEEKAKTQRISSATTTTIFNLNTQAKNRAEIKEVIVYSHGANTITLMVSDGTTDYRIKQAVLSADESFFLSEDNEPAVVGGSVAWSDVTGKPSTFTPSAHTHPSSEISDSTIAGRALLTGVDATAQRASLGLGTAATTASTDYATAAQGVLAGTAMQPGAFGLGANYPDGDADSTTNRTQFLRVSTGTRPTADNYHTIHMTRAAPNQSAQIMIRDGAATDRQRLFWRTRNGSGTWSSYFEAAPILSGATRPSSMLIPGLSFYDTAIDEPIWRNAANTGWFSISDVVTTAFSDSMHGIRAGGSLHANATTSVAGFMSSADKTKLDGVATGATANATDASLRDRATHTGTQTASTISDFNTAVAATPSVTANTAKVSNATHTGDVTGATALTIANDVVSNAKLANMPATTIKGNNLGVSGDPVDLTASEARTVLGLGSAALSDTTAFATAAQGTLADTASQPGHTHAQADVTGLVAALAGKASTTHTHVIADTTGLQTALDGKQPLSAVLTATTASFTTADETKLDGIAAGAQVNVPTDLSYDAPTRALSSSTGADVTLPIVSISDAGLAPPSGGGTTNFLRADGTWAAPAGGGGVPGGVSGEVQYNNAGAFSGAADVEIEGGQLRLPGIAVPAAPAAGGVKLFGVTNAGKSLPAFLGPVGTMACIQPALHCKSVFAVGPSNGTTAPTVFGGNLTTATTISHQQTIASANPWLATRRTRFQTSTTAGNASGMRTPYAQWFRGSAAGYGGFFFRCQFGHNIDLNGGQVFVGLAASTSALAGNPSALINMIGMGYDATDVSGSAWKLMRNDGTGTATKVDLGIGSSMARSNTTHGYDLVMFLAPGASEIFVKITNLHTGVVELDTSYTTDIPAVNVGMAFHAQVRNGAVAAAANLEVAKVYIETDY